MGILDHATSGSELPEQHLLRDHDRVREFAAAFLRGEITVEQYSQRTIAEISGRAPLEVLVPAEPPASVAVSVAAPVDVVGPVAEIAPVHAQDAGRALVLARAFVSGRISGSDFLRLIRDC
jgi:hypothetical protein